MFPLLHSHCISRLFDGTGFTPACSRWLSLYFPLTENHCLLTKSTISLTCMSVCFSVAMVATFMWLCVCLFASVSPLPSICPSWSLIALSVQIIPVRMEGLGMATSLLSPGQVLLTGGSSRGGRGAVPRILLRNQEGWRSVNVEPSVDLGEKAFCLLSVVHLDLTFSD